MKNVINYKPKIKGKKMVKIGTVTKNELGKNLFKIMIFRMGHRCYCLRRAFEKRKSREVRN